MWGRRSRRFWRSTLILRKWVSGKQLFTFYCQSFLLRNADCVCVFVQLLISKLEKNKAMKAEDKAQVMQTLNALTNSISKLQEEIKGLSSAHTLHSGIKTKAQVCAHTHTRLHECSSICVREPSSIDFLIGSVSHSNCVCSGSEGVVGYWTRSLQESTSWRRHSSAQTQIHTAAAWGIHTQTHGLLCTLLPKVPKTSTRRQWCTVFFYFFMVTKYRFVQVGVWRTQFFVCLCLPL